MSWELVGAVLLLLVVVGLFILRLFFLRTIKEKASRVGRSMGLDLGERIQRGGAGTLGTVLDIAGAATAPALVAEALSGLKRAAQTGPSTWTLRVIQPDDLVLEVTATEPARLRVVRSREALGVVQGAGDWKKALAAVETLAAARGVATRRQQVELVRSGAPIDGDHVWTPAG